MQFILLGQRAYVYSWSEYAHLFVWSGHVVILDLIGLRFILFPYTLSTGDVQQIGVHGFVLTGSFMTIPVAARLLRIVVVHYEHVTFLQMV